jgi:hypothetical protein
MSRSPGVEVVVDVLDGSVPVVVLKSEVDW